MKKLLLTLSAFIIVSCGGGGGGGGGAPAAPVTPAASVNLSADPTSVLLTNTTTLAWSTSNATSCSASGAWSGTKATSGTEAVTISTAGNNSFTLSCSGDGGSGSASVTVEGYRNTDGVVVDGYISGAEVFIDEDDDWVADSNESSTTSDNDGKFTIKYANGNLVSIGGTDLDSQTLLDNLLITHKLTGHSDFKAVTPVTSVAAFMTDAANLNAALGIDSSIDVATFDPVANKGDGGINDYLYEKGNQLTVLAYALQNITNNLNTTTETTQDYFKAITEEVEKEFTETTTKVDIETEAFITKTLNNVIEAKSITIDENAKGNTTKALSGILPIIQVKSTDDLTTAVIRFAFSTLQTDIQAIANGSATAEIVTSYTEDVLTYIAQDQNVDAGEIAPDISAIDDSATTAEDIAVEINVLLNDSYVTSSPLSLSATNAANGTISVSNNVITYSPDADYNGSDSFSYTLLQGEKTSSADVIITIEAVNDAPYFNNLLSNIDYGRNITISDGIFSFSTNVTEVSVGDVDSDNLSLSMTGTDSEYFDLSSGGILTFKNYEESQTKASYSINISVSDGELSSSKDITINVSRDDVITIVSKQPSSIDTIDGSAGNDSLIISYSGISNLGDFVISTEDGYTVLTDSNNGVIKYKSIENLTVGSYAYTEDVDADTFWNSSEYVLYMYDGGNTSSSDILQLSGFSASSDLTVKGSSSSDSMNLNIDRSSALTGSLNLNMGAGDDNFYSTKLKNDDSVDMGSGDDYIALMLSGTNGTPTIANANFTKLDGGSGSDTLSFGESETNNAELNLSMGNAVNFENIYGTSGTETIKGDANANLLRGGRGGADIIYGYAGNDILYGHGQDSDSASDSSYTSAKTLYGGEGDDILYGGAGEDILDGGTGKDTLTGGGGIDTFVIRSGDGSSDLASTNVITDFDLANDIISLVTLLYSELTIEQGSGDNQSDTLIKITSSGEYIYILSNTSASDLSAINFSSNSTASQTINGTSGDDILVGANGNDTFNGGAGSDSIYGQGGNDSINISDKTGSYLDLIDGGSGTDALSISYSLSDATETISVSVASNDNGNGNVYVIDGQQRKSIVLQVGKTYRFEHPTNHPLKFSTTSNGTHSGGVEYTSGVDTSTSGVTIIDVSSSSPSNLYYYCEIHSGMGNDITISTDSSSTTSSLSSFTISTEDDYMVLTDSNNGVIKYKSIENLTVGSYAYTEDEDADTFWNSSEYVLYMYDGGNTSSSDIQALSGFSASSDLTVKGSSSSDSMNLNIDRSSDLTGSLNLNMGAGDDNLYSAKIINSDSIDMGSGDDYIALMLSGTNGTPTIANANFTKLDGGSGSDTLSFGESAAFNGELTVTIGGAGGFENIYGTSGTETIKGDANANLLRGGRGGSDTIYGYAGNDILYGHGQDSDSASDSSYTSAKTLYGGEGDDILYGGAGEDILDGGTGKDTLTGGGGIDTFVIRSGDGSSDLASTNVVEDFAIGSDLIGRNGFNFNDLSIEQGTDDYQNHTVISKSDTGELLIILKNVTASSLTSDDFVAI